MGYTGVACEGSLQARQVGDLPPTALVVGAPEKVLCRRVAGSL